MFERFARSWELTKQSAAVLAQNKSLMVFPILSALASVVVIGSFLVPLALSGAFDHIHRGPKEYLLLFLFYFVGYCIQIFFNCGLMGSANMVFSGGRASVRDGLGMAWMRLPQILFYAAIAATVGMLLRMLEERVGWVGKIIVALLGAAWSIMTYFIAPVIVMEGLSGFEGVSRSTQLIRKTWGESVAKGLTWSGITLVATLAGIAMAIVMTIANVWLGLAFFVIYFLALATVISTLDGIFKVALYRYATWNVVPAGYSPELLHSAFVVKENKGWLGR